MTQTRTWVYDATTQRLQSVTHPESGTNTYDYNYDGTMLRKTDAKGQKVEFTYDAEGRVTAARRYWNASSEDTCARVDYYYNSQPFAGSFTQNASGRLAATATGCQGSGAGQLIEMYSYTAAGAVTKKRMRMVRSGGATVDKDVVYSYGSDGKLSTVLYPGASTPYTYTYDLMDRATKMTGVSAAYSNTIDHVKDVVYGAAGQITSMQYVQGETEVDSTGNGDLIGVPYFFQETKTYNSLYQMTKQTTTGTGGMAADIEYNFAATTNNGRITSRKNNVSGEEVVYGYDELNRLISASTTGTGGWGQNFSYDGFGNLLTQTPTKGTAPSITLSVDGATNRVNSSGWGYDANGNTMLMPIVGGSTVNAFDVDNRMVSSMGGTEFYGYAPDNKRVWKKEPSGVETVYFYGANGQKLVTYTVQTSPFALVAGRVNVHFGGKLIRADGVAVVHDRLGSVVARASCAACSTPSVTKKDYFPYGDEIGGGTTGNVDKFGTYHRDGTTGLDYAEANGNVPPGVTTDFERHLAEAVPE